MKESLSLTHSIRGPLESTLNDANRSVTAPRLPNKICRPTTVIHGLRTVEKAPQILETEMSLQQHDPTPLVASSSSQVELNRASTHDAGASHDDLAICDTRVKLILCFAALEAELIASQVARERVLNDLEKVKSISKPRHGRTCRKCAIPLCPGRKNVKSCTNHCQDCGKVECQGRNPKRPTRTCIDAWRDLD